MADDNNGKMPEDIAGRIIYVMRIFGPTTVLAGVLVWQGIEIVKALQDERQQAEAFNREQTKRVIECLTNSTRAIVGFEDVSQQYLQSIDSNTQQLEKSVKTLEGNAQLLRDTLREIKGKQ